MLNLCERYTTHKMLSHKVNTRLKSVAKLLGMDDLQFYAARHSWATIARNDCNISMDDVSLSLNHKSGHDVTDTYIKNDWSKIDNANRKVLDKLKG